MNFGIEHLYHDSEISNTYTSLDAKEKLRTRQINAREEKQLGRFNKLLDRAHTVLTKRQDWEKNSLEQELHIIKLKTASLDNSLKREMDAENNKNNKLPIITKSSNSLIKSHSNDSSGNSSGSSSNRTPSFRRNGKPVTVDLRYSAEVKMPPAEVTDAVTVYMKKAEVVARNLHRLYKRKRERTFYIKQAVDIIRANNQELLNEARMYVVQQALAEDIDDTDATSGIEDGNTVAQNQNESKNPEDKQSTDNNKTHTKDYVDDNNVNVNDENNNLEKVNTGTLHKTILPDLAHVSSVVVNPSDSGSYFDDKNAKWTDIFRIPEMWKLFDSRKKIKHVSKPAPQALVTLRGKLRKTLLR